MIIVFRSIIDKNLLLEYKNNIIVLSGGMQGEISNKWSSKERRERKRTSGNWLDFKQGSSSRMIRFV